MLCLHFTELSVRLMWKEISNFNHSCIRWYISVPWFEARTSGSRGVPGQTRAEVEHLEWWNEEEKINLLLFWNSIKTNLLEFVEYERQINEIDLILYLCVFFISLVFLLLLPLCAPFYLTFCLVARYLCHSFPICTYIRTCINVFLCVYMWFTKSSMFRQMYWIEKQKHTTDSLCCEWGKKVGVDAKTRTKKKIEMKRLWQRSWGKKTSREKC